MNLDTCRPRGRRRRHTHPGGGGDRAHRPPGTGRGGAPQRMLDELAIQGILFGEIRWREAVDAYRRFGKGRHPARLNFGACMTYAVTSLAGEPLLFKGHDFGLTDVEPVRWGLGPRLGKPRRVAGIIAFRGLSTASYVRTTPAPPDIGALPPIRDSASVPSRRRSDRPTAIRGRQWSRRGTPRERGGRVPGASPKVAGLGVIYAGDAVLPALGLENCPDRTGRPGDSGFPAGRGPGVGLRRDAGGGGAHGTRRRRLVRCQHRCRGPSSSSPSTT